jgi:hypothetical protein
MTGDTGKLARPVRAVGLALALTWALVMVTASDAIAQAPTGAATPDPDAGVLEFFRSTEIGGLVDTYYDYNTNKTPGDAPLRNFDTKHNQFALSMAQVWFNRVPSPDSRAGFKFRLNFGPATSMIHASEPGTLAVFQHIEEGYVSYLAPAGNGLQIDLGKFVTQHGAEVIEAKDDWNYSRSLLFTLAIPYYHMGVRATYAFNDKFTLMGDIVNGWNDVVDNNSRRTYGVQATVKPVPQVAIVQNYMGGPEQAGNNTDWRHLSDTTVTITATPRLSVNVNYDYGRDTVAGASVHWDGVAGYAKYEANKWLTISPRFEWFEDPQGFMTGAAQTLKEATLTGQVKLADNLLWRVEFRRDVSDAASFRKDTGELVKHQSTIAFGLLYAFSTRP